MSKSNNISGSRSVSSNSFNSLASDNEILDNNGLIDDLSINKRPTSTSSTQSRTQKSKTYTFLSQW